MKWGGPRILELPRLRGSRGRETGVGQGSQPFAGLQRSQLFPSAGPDLTRVRRPNQGTARASWQEGGGPGLEEGVRGGRRPARRAVRPAYPSEAEPAPAGRSSRRRGRSRLQEPLETESLAAAVTAGAAHRQASEHRAAGAGGGSGPRGDRGAARGVGWPVQEPPPSSRCWEARWREGTEEGRKEERVSRRAGTGRGTGRRRPGWGREGKGRRDPESDGALALDGRRSEGAGSQGPCGARAGGAAPGTRAGVGGEVSQLARLLPGLPAAVRPAPGWGWEAPAFPARACLVRARFGRRADNWGRPGRHAPLPYFVPFFLGTRRRVRRPGTRSALGVWRGNSGSQRGLRSHIPRGTPKQ